MSEISGVRKPHCAYLSDRYTIDLEGVLAADFWLGVEYLLDGNRAK